MDIVLSIGEKMARENVLTAYGLEKLYKRDLYYPLIVVQLADAYFEWLNKNGQDQTAYHILCEYIAVYENEIDHCFY